MSARTLNLDRLEAKCRRLPKALQEAVAKANDLNADEFMQKVATIIPKESGELASTLQKGPGKRPLSVQVSIGGPAAPYPAHLEFGHMSKGGTHVAGEPFWYPALHVLRRRFKGRIARAANKVIKAIAAGHG